MNETVTDEVGNIWFNLERIIEIEKLQLKLETRLKQKLYHASWRSRQKWMVLGQSGQSTRVKPSMFWTVKKSDGGKLSN